MMMVLVVVVSIMTDEQRSELICINAWSYFNSLHKYMFSRFYLL